MYDIVSNQLVAVASIRAAGVSFTQVGSRNCSIVRTSAGLYVATIAQGIPTNQCNVVMTARSALCLYDVTTSDGINYTINTATGTIASPTPADVDFDVLISRVDPPAV